MSNFLTTFRGELAALLAAAFWTISSVLYSRLGQRISPFQLTVIKGTLAIAMILMTLGLRGMLVPEIPTFSLLFLALSGIIGISWGDTAFFQTLNRLGPRRTLLVQTLAPSLTALLAAIFLGELLTILDICGIGLILFGVTWVVGDRVGETSTEAQNISEGVVWGAIAALSHAGGAILSRAALAETTTSPLSAALVRLVAGVVVLPLWMLWLPAERRVEWKPVRSGRIWGILIVAAFIGTYLAIWLQQTSLKFAPAGISQTLSATSPLFVLPIAAWTGEKIGIRAVLGAIAAVAGVSLLFA
ncbi:EamA family transporter [Baaleninema simplex]|uniref:EamA family transporter n=1 Tax=Baaleninema simplex TaxID=2862350 RepID=UPI000349E316